MKDQIFYLHLIHRKRSPFSLWRRLTDFVRRRNHHRTVIFRYAREVIPYGGIGVCAQTECIPYLICTPGLPRQANACHPFPGKGLKTVCGRGHLIRHFVTPSNSIPKGIECTGEGYTVCGRERDAEGVVPYE